APLPPPPAAPPPPPPPTTAGSAARAPASATSTSRLAGSSLNKPPTRAPAAPADDSKKPPARRTTAGAATAAAAGRATPSERRSTLAPATTPAAKRPSIASRPSADGTSTSRATPRASLAASTSAPAPAPRPSASRPSVAARTPHHIIPKAPVSIITPKTPVAHAKKPSLHAASSPTKGAPADALVHSPIDVPPRSYGPLKDKAASDAEVEVNKTVPFGPLHDSLPKVGEHDRRPGTAPSGPAQVDAESNRRSLAVMQDFFKETSLREKLQDQCDDLHRQVDRLQSTNTKLRKQLVDAQTAISDKDNEAAGAGLNSTGWDENKHNTIVDGMEKKFALETKLLEEQKQKLREEKRVAQEKEAAESAKAAELQQVLNDLNVELERQGREWDAEKLQLVEQGAKIDALNDHLTTLKEERDILLADLATANNTLETLQKNLSNLEQTHADQVSDRDDKIDSLTKTVDTLRSEVTAAQQRHNDASDEAKRSLETKSSESTKLVEELQAKVASLQQQHTDDLRHKDEAIALHIQTEKEMRHDLAKLQQRADQTTADLQSERAAHTEDLKARIAELQESSQHELSSKEADISSHLKSIEDLQNQITSLQQGETDGARMSQELAQQIQELKTAHEEALKLKTEQNEDLLQRLETVNDQISSDAAEIQQLKDEAEGLRKTVEALEETSKLDNASHATALDNLQKELSDVKKKAETAKSDLEAAKDRHRQDLRVLGEDHDAEIDSLRADLEGDAKKRLDKLQAEYDALVEEKNTALEGHEKSLADRTKELEEAQKQISLLKQSSGSTSQGLEEAVAKHQQVLEEKAALAEAHYTAQKQVADLEARVETLTRENALIADLQARVETLTRENALIADLQARIDAMTEDKQAASETLAASEASFTKLKAELDGLAEEKQSLSDERTKSEQALGQVRDELQASVQNYRALEDKHTNLEKTLTSLKAQHSSVLEEKSAMEETHARTMEALKQDSENATKQTLSELQSKYDALVDEQRNIETSQASAREDIQARCDALVKQLAHAESKLEESTTAQKAAEKAQAEALERALDSQRQEIEQKYVALLEEVQADCAKLEQHMDTILSEKQSALSELQAQVDSLKRELADKEELDSAGLAEVSKRYEMLLDEQSATDKKVHETAMEELRKALQEEHKHAMDDAHAELESLRNALASKETTDSAGLAEVTEKYESLLAEQSAADKRDYEAELALLKDSADTDLNETKERYEALLVEKDSLKAELEHARDDARSEVERLRLELESKEQSEAAEAADANKKYAALLAEKTAADKAHENALTALKQSHESELERAIAELQSQNRALQDTFAKMDGEHQQTLAQLKAGLESDQSSNTDALRQQLERAQEEHTAAIEQMVKSHEDAISELMVGMQNSAADAVQQLQKKHDALEAQIEALKAGHASEIEAVERDNAKQQDLYNDLHARFDKVVIELESSSEDVKRLQDTIEAIEAERDRAYKAAAEAEDRIETFKGEVVRKHLARVEPLQKENTALLNKIDRLQDMLAAGDRIARAAASLGEKREMTALAEESDEEQDGSASAGSGASAPGVPRAAPLLNGTAKDVVGTQLAAMQETLSQLSALNNDAIAESERTAQRLTERE
ncbi:adventurous gliding protein Z, partial [Stagonosporopsis vannaccii]